MTQIIIMLLCLTVVFSALLMSLSTLFRMCGDIISEAEEDFEL